MRPKISGMHINTIILHMEGNVHGARVSVAAGRVSKAAFSSTTTCFLLLHLQYAFNEYKNSTEQRYQNVCALQPRNRICHFAEDERRTTPTHPIHLNYIYNSIFPYVLLCKAGHVLLIRAMNKKNKRNGVQ